MWNVLSDCFETALCFEVFKQEFKKRKDERCPFEICKTFIQQVRFI